MEGDNANLNIILQLIDQASAKIKETIGDAQKAQTDLQKVSDKSSNSITKGFKDAGRAIKDFRQTLFVSSVAVAAIAGVTKEWSERNQETKDALFAIGQAGKDLAVEIGQLLAPAIIALAEVVQKSLGFIQGLFDAIRNGYESLFHGLTYGIQYIVSFFSAIKEGVSVVEAHKIAMNTASFAAEEMTRKFSAGMQQNITSTDSAKKKLDEYNSSLNDLYLLFKAGQISAAEYFQGVLANNNRLMTQNEIIAQQTRQYIDLINEVSNQDLLRFEASMASKMELFSTYRDLYIQGHADMFSFASSMAQQFHAQMSDALSSIIMGEKSAKEAMKEFGQAMIKAIVDYMVQQAVAWAVSQALQLVIGASTATMASTLAMAWAPAAAMASLATLGGNAAPAIAGMTTTTAAAYALAIPKGMAYGGEGIVTKPTLFLAGEAGPERYSFDPLGPGRGGSGRESVRQVINHIDVQVNYPTVRSDQDIEKIADAVSKRIAQEAERL